MDILKTIYNKIISIFTPQEEKILNAENAQAILYFKKSLSYEEMLSQLKKYIFRKIKIKAYSGYNYLIVEIPEWLTIESKIAIKEELQNLNYSTDEIINLLIIHWDKKS